MISSQSIDNRPLLRDAQASDAGDEKSVVVEAQIIPNPKPLFPILTRLPAELIKHTMTFLTPIELYFCLFIREKSIVENYASYVQIEKTRRTQLFHKDVKQLNDGFKYGLNYVQACYYLPIFNEQAATEYPETKWKFDLDKMNVKEEIPNLRRYAGLIRNTIRGIARSVMCEPLELLPGFAYRCEAVSFITAQLAGAAGLLTAVGAGFFAGCTGSLCMPTMPFVYMLSSECGCYIVTSLGSLCASYSRTSLPIYKNIKNIQKNLEVLHSLSYKGTFFASSERSANNNQAADVAKAKNKSRPPTY